MSAKRRREKGILRMQYILSWATPCINCGRNEVHYVPLARGESGYFFCGAV